MDLSLFTNSDTYFALATLTLLELILGIDNIIFISILSSKLPAARQARARFLGLLMAMLSRIALLLSLSWIMRLTAPLFNIMNFEISGRDLILIGGGLFLIAKSTFEIHDKLEGAEEEAHKSTGKGTLISVVAQIAVLDIIFSLDSVITAIGMTDKIVVMVTAIVLSVLFMMVAAGSISRFVDGHPTIKILALSFLILIGVALLGEGLDLHIPRAYIYFSIAFATLVELLNLRLRRGRGIKSNLDTTNTDNSEAANS